VVKIRRQAAADDVAVVALVERVVTTRDHAAFGHLYDRFVERIYRYLYARCGTQADAEDLTEQVFVKAWEGIDQYREQGSPFDVWLYGLAHNAFVDGRHGATDRHASAAQLDTDVFARALRSLTPKQQQVIHLRFTANLDTSEIALIMQAREGAIRALQMRALIRLRRILDEQGVFGDDGADAG
jgi:RNA polymerase sigma-70 factor (ECF subfamily)